MRVCDPIGLYDSGSGGLSVWRAVRDRLPAESLVYFGDGANCPYGQLESVKICELAERAVGELVERGCKLIVVACNTVTAVAIETLRERYSGVDIVGMEPAVKPACLNTRTGVVGVIATQHSLDGGLFHRTAAKYGEDVRVVTAFGRGFVELVERGELSGVEAERVVREVVEPMLAEGVDQIVLGCTHYPFLIPLLRSVAPEVTIVDPSSAVARRVEQLLSERGLLCGGADAKYEFLSFADSQYCEMLRERAMRL